MVYHLPKLNSEIVRSFYMGVCFMVLFSGFYTLSNLEKLFLASTQAENPSFTGDGYVSLAILYIAFSIFMWVVPSIVSLCGPKITLIIGSLGYSLFIASFLTESAWLLYVGSVCCGVSASMLWTTQGNYMVLISSSLTLTRNLAIFNIIWQSAMFYGNIFAYLVLEGKDHLDRDTRTTVILALLGISIAATAIMCFLPTPTSSDGKKIKEDHGGPIVALKKTWEIATTKYMLILFISFVYMGLQICFMSGVYGSCVGFTKQLDHSKQLVPLIGLIIGAGEIISEIGLICLGKRVAKWRYGQTTVVLVALIIEYAAFVMVYLNLPNNSVFGETDDLSILPASWWNAVVAALLIGLSDGIYMSMIPSIVGTIFPNDSVYGCAMFTFVFSLFSAVGFFSSNYIGLYWQLLVLTITGTLGAFCYIYVSLDMHRRAEQDRKEQTKL
ncbi:UNC93-like protein MFSD11 [Homalodisca vitripennis]|uniref:UNC93-like protein MFSD11 n=1 Tax=Homalodisca vitripennis TaxID=197043 RepID=UPI001EEBA6FC|nr:UNC93-like protein MFSD11 [Homalodisca vitripennis]